MFWVGGTQDISKNVGVIIEIGPISISISIEIRRANDPSRIRLVSKD